MRPGRIQIRPLGGWPGCLVMILFSVVASVVGTVLLNLLLRSPQGVYVMAGWSASFGRNANPRRPAADQPYSARPHLL